MLSLLESLKGLGSKEVQPFDAARQSAEKVVIGFDSLYNSNHEWLNGVMRESLTFHLKVPHAQKPPMNIMLVFNSGLFYFVESKPKFNRVFLKKNEKRHYKEVSREELIEEIYKFY
ncbi:hypothetical protein CBQ28_02220 [Pseudoalteromonas sp. GCY]|uniref:hypothetical protein n=1 Tax=Pseudoalteromonas sp. GCY TaxID=2003316 RepID=UPI000BFF0E36|nr:hypothetical protein [Pseudoalteromonas sp. GCY]PHI38846.1 hypothetical protein CBQ28_02220 [Pseudoalteromonas sp. GCY]QQQ65942.1 hypothetical protein JJQ94_16715 [Pseudoalteromonas sp. GCY]